MQPIYIPQLTHAPQQTETLEFEEFLPDLETLTPVKGQLRVKHQGNYLEVSGQAEAIMTLTCNRCLQRYNYRLSIKPSELIWLSEPMDESELELEREVALEELVESLPPQGYFDPGTWVYEQLCLEIPQKQLCARNCAGIQPKQTDTTEVKPAVDHRWASLEALKGQLPS